MRISKRHARFVLVCLFAGAMFSAWFVPAEPQPVVIGQYPTVEAQS